eukprot:scaffold232389_cov33-Prasinocladus_malaysianus.AAC.1
MRRSETPAVLAVLLGSLVAGTTQATRGAWSVGYEMKTAMLPWFEPAANYTPGVSVDGALSFLSDDLFYLTIQGLLNFTVDGVPEDPMTGTLHIHAGSSCED